MSRADDTRRRLLQQARLAFAAKGHDGVSLQRDVLHPSGVSNGSFYHQFDDKTDLLVALLEEAAEAGRSALRETIGASVAGGLVERARRGFELWFTLVDGAEDLFRIQLRERENPDPRVRELIRDLRRRWVAGIAANLDDQADGASIDPDLIARIVASLAYGVLAEYLDTPSGERTELRSRFLADLPAFVVGGIAELSRQPTQPRSRGEVRRTTARRV